MEPKYTKVRKQALDWFADKLPSSLGGNVVKEKRKRKKKVDDAYSAGK